MIIQYAKELPIVNTESLPSGLRCPFLLCIKGEGNALIAKAWKRVQPDNLKKGEVLIKF